MPVNHFGAADSSFASDVIGSIDAQFNTTALSNFTATAGQLTGALFTALECTANGANALTTRTANQMMADLDAEFGVPVPKDGTFSYLLRITNSGDNTVTLTAGAGVTITGTATIATGKTRDFVVTVNANGTMTFQNVGGGTL